MMRDLLIVCLAMVVFQCVEFVGFLLPGEPGESGGSLSVDVVRIGATVAALVSFILAGGVFDECYIKRPEEPETEDDQ